MDGLQLKRFLAVRLGRPTSNAALFLRAGEWVEVRSKEEILATLDMRGRLDGLPFMPQMFQYCGQRLQVFRRAHKTCDTIHNSGGRRMVDCVHLDGPRCDGAVYGGCGAMCTIFWKEAWLKRAGVEADAAAPSKLGAGCSEAEVLAGTKGPEWKPDEPQYACQATDLLAATKPLPWWQVLQYIEDYTSGNATLSELAGGVGFVLSRVFVNRVGFGLGIRDRLIAAYDFVQRSRGRTQFPWKVGRVPKGTRTPLVQLRLHKGERVRVRSYEEILDTLDANNKNRGMYFDAEEVPYCGRMGNVVSRVERIVDERTGRMISMGAGGAVILDGVWCKGHYSTNRLHCPRALLSFWRDAWLEPVEPAQSEVVGDAAQVVS